MVEPTSPLSNSDLRFGSFDLETLLVNPTRITIVDDVVTRGRMIMAVAIILARRFPGLPYLRFREPRLVLR